ncbi:MAG: beta-glucanosyltransferase [Phylliscum demangeonii]|nr:MAG: beta-glucanosyltransferase [Phylliscum demangeonii]
MKTFGAWAAALAILSAGSAASSVRSVKRSITSVTVKGNAFFAGTTRFYVRGIDYQPGGSSNVVDPIADLKTCTRDIAEFKKLAINTVRVYTVDNTLNHDSCMSALAEAGIYLVLDVNTPKYSINRADPAASYNDVYLQSVFATIDAFAKYDNTLAFFSGNEVINDVGSTKAAPYVKAVTRDIRQYIGSRGYRKIPVGYSAADVAENRFSMAQYMNCGTDDERSDFFAFNDYSWCDPSSFQTSGWDTKTALFGNYSIPLFLSEYGCNKDNRKRTFEEVASLYSTDMSAVFSGGLVYEYSEEGNRYGLVTIDPASGAVREGDDFRALQAAYAAQKDPAGDAGYKSSGAASACPAPSDNWAVANDTLPAIPGPAQHFMKEGAGPGPGLAGAGSQNAGTASSATAAPGSGTPAVAASPSPSPSPKKSAATSARPGSSSAPGAAVAVAVAALVVLLSAGVGVAGRG